MTRRDRSRVFFLGLAGLFRECRSLFTHGVNLRASARRKNPCWQRFTSLCLFEQMYRRNGRIYWCKVLRPSSNAEACGMERLFQSCSAEISPCKADTLGARHYFRCQSLVYDAASPVPLVCELIAAHSVGALEALRPCADFNCFPRPYLLSRGYMRSPYHFQ
jgi:hypothetical protein